MCIDLGALAIKSGRRSLNGRPADLHDDDFRLSLRISQQKECHRVSRAPLLYDRFNRSEDKNHTF